MSTRSQPARPAHTTTTLLADALAMLACPVCHASLSLEGADAVLCTGCRRNYPLRDGIPVLIAGRSLEGNAT